MTTTPALRRFGTPRALIGFALAGLLLALLPTLITSLSLGSYFITLVFQMFVWGTLASSWNFFCGYSGYSSFGHGAFFGIGMYSTSTLMVRLQLPFLLTLPLAGLVAALVALGIGSVVFRLRQFRGELFSLLTLAITFICATLVNNIDEVDGGTGVYLRGSDVSGFAQQNTTGLYYVSLAILLLTVYLSYYIYHSRWGQALFAIRDDEDAADGVGIPTYRYKLVTFALSSFMVGMIGGTQAIFLGYIDSVTAFAVLTPLLALMMSIFGGASLWWGPLVGAVLITLLRQTLTSADTAVINQIIIGMALILTVLFMPEGVGGRAAKLAKRLSPARESAPAAPPAGKGAGND